MRKAVMLSLVVFLGGCWFGKPPKPFTDELALLPPIGEIIEVRQSPVKVLFLNAKQQKPGKSGTLLRPGEKITTDRNGTVQLRIKGGTISRMARYTQLELVSATSLALHYGKTLVWTTTPLDIQTNYGTIVLNKAVAYIDMPPSPWAWRSILVFKGTASTSLWQSQHRVAVKSGEQLIVTPWGIPLRQKITPAQRTAWLSGSAGLFKFTNQFPTEAKLLAQWQLENKQSKKPVRKVKPIPKQYWQPPASDNYNSYPDYAPEPEYPVQYSYPTAYTPPRRSAPPPPPPTVVADPPPEYIPIEPVAAEPLPVTQPIVPEPIVERADREE